MRVQVSGGREMTAGFRLVAGVRRGINRRGPDRRGRLSLREHWRLNHWSQVFWVLE